MRTRPEGKAEGFDPDQPRDESGRWTSGGGDGGGTAAGAAPVAAAGLPQPPAPPSAEVAAAARETGREAVSHVPKTPGRENGTGSLDDPIAVGSDLDRAVREIYAGNHVRLDQPTQVATLVDRLGDYAQDAVDRGEKAPTYDLGKVSIAGTNLFCVDEETEILSMRGWLRYVEVRSGDTVLTLDHDSGTSVWQLVDGVHVFPAERRLMVAMEGKTHSSLTTPHHRWPVVKRRRAHPRQWACSAELGFDDAIPAAAPCATLPTTPIYEDALVELVAWTWTEGNLGRKSHGDPVRIYQSQSANPSYCLAIRGALTAFYGDATAVDMRSIKAAAVGSRTGEIRAATPAWRESYNAAIGVVSFHLNKAAAAPILEHMDADKVVKPEFILALTEHQLRLFVERSIDADGCRQPRIVCLSQRSRARVQAFEMACVLLGMKPHTSAYARRGPDHKTGKVGEVTFTTLVSKVKYLHPWTAASMRRVRKGFTIAAVAHEGIVWCPTTPNQTWLARRHGSVYYTGNTQQSLGIPRVQMPQLDGTPIPGSPADSFPKDAKGGVNLGEQFREAMEDNGHKVTNERVDPSTLRATQMDLVGPKVASLSRAIEAGTMRSRDIFVTRDNYVIDGHHQWAATVLANLRAGEDQFEIGVQRVDTDIGTALDSANEFVTAMGIPPKAGVAKTIEAVKRLMAWMADVEAQYAPVPEKQKDEPAMPSETGLKTHWQKHREQMARDAQLEERVKRYRLSLFE
jgi:hypothetical protein